MFGQLNSIEFNIYTYILCIKNHRSILNVYIYIIFILTLKSCAMLHKIYIYEKMKTKKQTKLCIIWKNDENTAVIKYPEFKNSSAYIYKSVQKKPPKNIQPAFLYGKQHALLYIVLCSIYI